MGHTLEIVQIVPHHCTCSQSTRSKAEMNLDLVEELKEEQIESCS